MTATPVLEERTVINRVDLVELLKRVEPALSAKNFIEVFSCFCFKKQTVTAFDDIVAISSPCHLEVEGGLRGKVLIDFVHAARGVDVAVEVGEDGNEAVIRSGRSRLTMPLLGMDDFIFEFPETPGVELPVTEEFLNAFGQCLLSVGTDPSHPWRLGVTVSFDQTGVTFYSSDTTTITTRRLEMPVAKKLVGRSFIFPPRFSELLAGLAKREEADVIIVDDDWVEARFKSQLRLWSKTVKAVEVERYTEMLATLDEARASRKVPKGFIAALDRALVVLSSRSEHGQLTEFTVADGKMKLFTKSPIGEVRDSFKLPEHPDVAVKAPPDRIKRAIEFATRMGIHERCIVLEDDSGYRYLVSVITPD